MESAKQTVKVVFAVPKLQFIKKSLLMNLFAILPTSILFMGTFSARLIIFGIVICIPMLFIFSLFNWFTLDDDNQLIIKGFKSKIPYKKISAIFIDQSRTRLNISIRRKWMGTMRLISGVDLSEKNSIIQELTKRFPHQIIKERTHYAFKITLILFFVPFAINAIHSLYMQRKYPDLFKTQEILSLDISQNRPVAGNRYNVENNSFFLPATFTFVNHEKGILRFEDAANKIKLTATGRGIPLNRLRGLTIGITDSYDLAKIGINAEFGFFPLLARSIFVFIGGAENNVIYEFHRNSIKGLIIQGADKKEEITNIILVDRQNELELNFQLKSATRIDRKALISLVEALR